MTMRALYVGRFQPFHLGHVEVLKKILKECSEVIIIVGSAQHSHTLENPFTAGERIQMIRETLDEERISNIYVIPVEDLNRHSLWVQYVESLAPHFDVVFSNEPLTGRLFKEAGYTVKEIPLMHREEWSGTEIRKKMLQNGEWKQCLPQTVVRIIEEIDGVNRMKELSRSDVK